MALKTNSKQAKANIYNYIREYSEDYLQDDYGIEPEAISTKAGLYKTIYNIYREEMRPDCPYYKRYPDQVVFKEWAQGLAMGGLFCFYYNREAREDVAQILQETPEEAQKYSEERAEELLTYLIYREVVKEAR